MPDGGAANDMILHLRDFPHGATRFECVLQVELDDERRDVGEPESHPRNPAQQQEDREGAPGWGEVEDL